MSAGTTVTNRATPFSIALALSIPFVLYGLFRYWFVVETLKGGESPTDALFSDWQLSVTILLWLGLCLWALWPTGV